MITILLINTPFVGRSPTKKPWLLNRSLSRNSNDKSGQDKTRLLNPFLFFKYVQTIHTITLPIIRKAKTKNSISLKKKIYQSRKLRIHLYLSSTNILSCNQIVGNVYLVDRPNRVPMLTIHWAVGQPSWWNAYGMGTSTSFFAFVRNLSY